VQREHIGAYLTRQPKQLRKRERADEIAGGAEMNRDHLMGYRPAAAAVFLEAWTLPLHGPRYPLGAPVAVLKARRDEEKALRAHFEQLRSKPFFRVDHRHMTTADQIGAYQMGKAAMVKAQALGLPVVRKQTFQDAGTVTGNVTVAQYVADAPVAMFPAIGGCVQGAGPKAQAQAMEGSQFGGGLLGAVRRAYTGYDVLPAGSAVGLDFSDGTAG
jgi:hypothetical protein